MSLIKPNHVAIQSSLNFLKLAFEQDLYPTSISPYVEGGIGITYDSRLSPKYAYVEFYNDGTMVTLTDTNGKMRTVFEGNGSETSDLMESVNHLLNHFRVT